MLRCQGCVASKGDVGWVADLGGRAGPLGATRPCPEAGRPAELGGPRARKHARTHALTHAHRHWLTHTLLPSAAGVEARTPHGLSQDVFGDGNACLQARLIGKTAIFKKCMLGNW